MKLIKKDLFKIKEKMENIRTMQKILLQLILLTIHKMFKICKILQWIKE